MTVDQSREVAVSSQDDVVLVRQAVRTAALQIGLNLIDQTKIVTAASELARNTFVHGGGGFTRIEIVSEGVRRGIRLTFEDKGKGIADIDQAMKDGFTSGGGLGLGLGGAKRLSNDFQIESRPGEGTRITIARWK
ncbi:MAG: anti-sigma regulatory factor [Bryobacteraceae bacterium]